MPERMATECVSAKQDDVHRQNEGANTDAPRRFVGHWVGKPLSLPRIVSEKSDENDRKKKEVTMNVLHDQRQRIFPTIAFARFTDST